MKSLQVPFALLVGTLVGCASPSALAGPYAGIQHKSLSGTRSTVDYDTTQVNATFGYEVVTASQLKHLVEYLGPISSSNGQIAQYSVETTIMSIGYKLMYRGLPKP